MAGRRLEMLRTMLRIRKVEQALLDLSQQKEPLVIGSIHLCAGQEAVPVGARAALTGVDKVLATYRGHGWALCFGVALEQLIGEVCHRSIGLNGGRGGSAYMMAPDTPFIGENSIVGAGVTVGCGVAMAMDAQGTGGVTVVSIGDGAMNQGATHEGLAFAAARNLSLIVICENNGWSEMTPTSLMFRNERMASRLGGYGIKACTIDGTNPVAVQDTVALAAKAARSGEGPFFIECNVPRLWGHYNRDVEHYRPKEDRAKARDLDPVELLVRRLVEEGPTSPADIERLRAEVDQEVDAAVAKVVASPTTDPASARDHVCAAIDVRRDAAPVGETREMTYVQAVNAALARELQDPRTVIYGEDVGHAGGIFAATRNLQREFGPARVFDVPIAENAILGSAVGAALMGMRPIVEIMWADFMLVALDQLINQAANIRYVTGGRSHVPIVVRTQQGSTPGSCAQHSQCLEALLTHIPGLRVALPATPQDAYSVLRAAAASEDPCIVIEARGLYQNKAVVTLHDAPGPIGRAVVRKAGADGLIICWGTMVPAAIEAARQIEAEGAKVMVLDLVWLSPLDEAAIADAVARTTGPIVIAHEANRTGGFGAEIGMRILESARGLDGWRITRLATPDCRMPAAPHLRAALVPGADEIAAAVRDQLLGTDQNAPASRRQGTGTPRSGAVTA